MALSPADLSNKYINAKMWNKNSQMYLQLDLGIPLLALSAACALEEETKQCDVCARVVLHLELKLAKKIGTLTFLCNSSSTSLSIPTEQSGFT